MTKTARCNFCGRTFTSSQGVRAHLKSCTDYQTRKNKPKEPPREHIRLPRQPNGILPKVSKYPGAIVPKAPNYASVPERDEFQYLDEGLLNERHRSEEEEEKRRFQNEREASRRQEEDERRKHMEELARAEKKKREIMQDVKRFAVDWYITSKDIPNEARANAKLKIEKVLSGLQILELPIFELIEIATGIRDKIYKSYLNEVEKSKETEVDMGKTRLFSGFFWCPDCEIEYEIERAGESELICDNCDGDLEEVQDDENDEDD